MRQLKLVFQLSIILSVQLSAFIIYAQDCGCDHVIEPSSSLQVINDSDFDYQPGDTFCFQAGVYDAIRLKGFKGTANAPLLFKPCGGKVEIKATTYTALQFIESQYIHLTGQGITGTEYGIHISESKSGTSGVSVAYLSSDFEIDHLEISNVGFAGIVAKTDPSCDDPDTWRSNFTLENLKIHNNYIHDTGGEGMYVGPTYGYETTTLADDCDQGFAHLLHNVEIYDNKLSNLGWDGLQVSLASENLQIYNNTIENYGTRLEGNQNFGLALGGGCKGRIYNNIILQDDAYAVERQRGISMINTISGTYVYNNVIEGAGEYGIWMHIRMTSEATNDDGYYFFNNTIIKPKGVGILYNNCIPQGGGCRPRMKNAFYNNLIIDPGANYENSGFWKTADEAFVDFITKEVRDNAVKSNNLFSRDMNAIGFTDVESNNYALTENSPAVDYGRDLLQYDINYDLNNSFRPVGEAFDAGAYEFGASNQPPVAVVEQNLIEILIGETTVLDGRESFDPDGSIEGYIWSVSSGDANDVVIDNANVALTAATFSKSGEYNITFRVEDDEGALDQEDIRVIVSDPVSNEEPTAIAGEDVNLIQGSSLQLNGGNSFDSDGEIVNYSWELHSGNSDNIDIEEPQMAITNVRFYEAGVFDFKLTVTDDFGDVDTDFITVTVEPLPSNQKPVADAGADQVIDLDKTLLLNGSNSFDPDGTIVAYFWDVAEGDRNTLTIFEPHSSTTDVAFQKSGIYKFILQVTDNESEVAYDTTYVVVEEIVEENESPIANAGNDKVVTSGNQFWLDGSNSSDPDNNISKFQWELIEGEGNAVTLNQTDMAIVNGVINRPGIYKFQLEVSDDKGLTDYDSIVVRVNNQSPIAIIESENFTRSGSTVSLTGASSYDPDGRIISFIWKILEGEDEEIKLVDTSTYNAQVEVFLPGSYIIQLTVLDEFGAKDSTTNLIEVGNRAPNAVALDTVYAKVGATLELNGSDSYDTDGYIKEFNWELWSGETNYVYLWEHDSSVAKASITKAGLYHFKLTIVDDHDAEGEVILPVIVKEDEVSGTKITQLLKIRVYPNPTKEYINVDFSGARSSSTSIRIIDLNGNIIKHETRLTTAFKDNSFRIDMSELREGLYIVNVKNGLKRAIKKIIVKR